jgi:6-phosphogluconolactonase
VDGNTFLRSAISLVSAGTLLVAIGCAHSTGAHGTGVEFAYVANADDNTVSAYTVNATSGSLTPAAGSPFATGDDPESVAVDPAGKFAYVSNYGENALDGSVSAYTIDAAGGALTPLSGSPFATGSEPEAVVVDPTGKFAYVANFQNWTISADTIDATSGALRPVAGSPFATGEGPKDVVVTRSQ